MEVVKRMRKVFVLLMIVASLLVLFTNIGLFLHTKNIISLFLIFASFIAGWLNTNIFLQMK